jgi:N-acyl-D-aspartate/D-glutamate deacylase
MGVNKGAIAEGFRADLVVVDLESPTTITDDMMASACRWTPYRGMEGVFPEAVMMGGELVVEDGQFVGIQGRGRFMGSPGGGAAGGNSRGVRPGSISGGVDPTERHDNGGGGGMRRMPGGE